MVNTKALCSFRTTAFRDGEVQACCNTDDYTYSSDDQTPGNPREYQERTGAVLFLSSRTRPDISVAVNPLCRNNASPTSSNMVAAKRVLRYLKGTTDFGLRFDRSGERMVGYSDSDWAGDKVDRKSTSGLLIMYSDSPVYWRTTKQDCVAKSSTEAEYVALSNLCEVVVWLREILSNMDSKQHGATQVHEDNQGAIAWSEDGVRNAKHIAIRRNFAKELFDNGEIELCYCPTQDMIADVFTKPLQRVKFEKHRSALRVLEMPLKR